MPAVVDTTVEPRGRADAPAVAAALVTVVAWASAFVGIRAAGEHIAARPTDAGAALVRRRRPRVRRARAAGAPAAAQRPGAAGRGRPAVVRRLQRAPERGRAAGRRRDRGDAGQRRPGL